MSQHAKIKVVGIIGDGQLALMLADVLSQRGWPFWCLGESRNSPMMASYPQHMVADRDFFQKQCDVFTLENEFLSSAELETLLREKSGTLFPELSSYDHFSNKISQRTLYQKLGLPSPKWKALQNDPEMILSSFAFPFIVKASAGGYDGKGVRVVNNRNEFDQALKDFGFPGNELLIEEKVTISKEVAQGFLRHEEGHHTLLPLVETLQQNGICHTVQYPARIPASIQAEVTSILQKLIDFPLIGIFNFEFFVTENGRVLINEGAPRPHNSQHLTIDASTHSQFTLLADYLQGEGPFPLEVKTKKSSMVNILGKSKGKNHQLNLPSLPAGISIKPKLYAKEECSPGRKMGHVNLIDETGDHDLIKLSEDVFKDYYL